MSSDQSTAVRTTAPPPTARARELDDDRDRGRGTLLVLLWSAVLSVVVFLPMLTGRGVALINDMIFVPRQPVKGAWLGLDGSTTGAVPADFLVSVATFVLPGDLLQKVILVVVVIVAGTGAGAAVSNLGLAPRLVAATFYVWNPFVFERFAVGDWTLVVAYSMLPWIVWGARRVHTGAVGEWAPVVAFMALAGWMNPIGGVLALLLGVILVSRRSARAGLAVLVAGVVVNLATLVPALLRRGGATVDPASAEAYALSSEGGLGVFGNVLTLGGVWDPTAAAPGRDQLIVVLLALVLTAACIAGAILLARRAGGGSIGGIGVLAVIGVVIALLGAFDGTRGVLASLADSVPGGSLLVDGHAWLAPLALFLAVGLAGLVAEVSSRVTGAAVVAAVGVVAIAAPIALLPSLALGLDGRYELARFPSGWWEVRAELEQLEPAGILSVPFTEERAYRWNENRESFDAAPRYFFGDIVVEDARTIDGVELDGTDSRVANVREALAGRPAELAEALAFSGIDTVLVERNVDGPVPPLGRLGAERVYQGPFLEVWSLADPTTRSPNTPPAIVIIIADILAALVAIGALVAWVGSGRRRRDDVAPAYAAGAAAPRGPAPAAAGPGPGTDYPTQVTPPVARPGAGPGPGSGSPTQVTPPVERPGPGPASTDAPTQVTPPAERPDAGPSAPPPRR